MQGFGAYYQTTYNKPIEGLGAYYETRENWRIGQGQDNLGQTPTPVSFAEQALEETLKSISAGQVMTPWAERQGDLDWQDIQVPSENYLVYPLTDKVLDAAKSASFGHEPNWVAILATKPAMIDAVDQALTGRPYRLASTQGIYGQADGHPVPQPLVLYWLELRDDPHDLSGGRGSMEAAAKQLGGALVFPMPVPRSGEERDHPDVGFTTAIGVAGAPKVPVVLPAQQASVAAPGGVNKVLVLAGLAGVIGLGWWYYKKRKV